ncbi:MAG: hypothetical protein CMM08_03490 [Rhodospirillaceae bacterium]|nr:hypothetical protein [Rhodospirillaceae bacterium]
MIRVDARRACGFVDKANALPTTPQAQQHQQKRSIDVVPKADNLVCYRQSQLSNTLVGEKVADLRKGAEITKAKAK